MEEGSQHHAPAALPPGKYPIPTVQKYGSPDSNITGYKAITVQVTEK
jgi:hypothetical protein